VKNKLNKGGKLMKKKIAMKSLKMVKKEKALKNTAQCCAKISPIVVGCHD
jgi:hypothetical protein